MTENQLVERVLENVREEIRVEVAYALELAFSSEEQSSSRRCAATCAGNQATDTISPLPQPSDATELVELRDFLAGIGTLDGVGFGDRPDGERGAFWWRKYLDRIDQAQARATAAEALLRDAFGLFAHGVGAMTENGDKANQERNIAEAKRILAAISSHQDEQG